MNHEDQKADGRITSGKYLPRKERTDPHENLSKILKKETIGNSLPDEGISQGLKKSPAENAFLTKVH